MRAGQIPDHDFFRLKEALPARPVHLRRKRPVDEPPLVIDSMPVQLALHFADGTSMLWEELADRLQQINLRTGFNLLVLVSACFGAYFLGMLSAVRASPC
jgi:hypothetical protein